MTRDDAARPCGSECNDGLVQAGYVNSDELDQLGCEEAISLIAERRPSGWRKTPIYTADALRAAVAAERERWESALGAEMPPDFKSWHQNSAAERPEVAAWVIRNLRERQLYDAAAVRTMIANAWAAGYYDAGYTHDSAYACAQAEKCADAFLGTNVGGEA